MFIFQYPGQPQDPLHVINDLSMYFTFRLNRSGTTPCFNWLASTWTPKFSQCFSLLRPPPSCGRDCHSENIFFTASAWNWSFSLKAYGTNSKLFAHLFTTAFHMFSFKVIQKIAETKKYWIATGCPVGIDLPAHKCRCGTCSRVWPTGNTDRSQVTYSSAGTKNFSQKSTLCAGSGSLVDVTALLRDKVKDSICTVC